MRANGKPNGRFELPQLTPVNYSLTEGTDIPPPPDSPIEEEKAPAPPPVGDKPTEQATANGPTVSTTKANGIYDGRGRTSNADHEPPLSPASTTRPGSIRRFLSRRSLNSNYTNGNGSRSTDDLHGAGERPGTSLTQPKRSTSWFRRLGSSSTGTTGGNRTSVVYENSNPPTVDKPEKKGPPPPKLPELNQLKAKIADDDEGSLGGGEMFKNIN